MRINELVAEQTDIDEGIGSAIGKGVGSLARGVGAVAGGAVGAWDAAKSGFKTGRHYVSGQGTPGDPAHYYDHQGPNTTTIQSPGAEAPAAGAAPAPASSGDIKGIMAAIGKLDPASKKQLSGELTKSIAATPTPPQAGKPASSGATPPQPGQPASSGATPPQPGQPASSSATPPAADELDDVKKNAGLSTAATYSGGQTQGPAPSKVSYSGMPKPAALPQATAAQGAYSVKGQQTATPPAAPKPTANFSGGQTQGPAPSKVNFATTAPAAPKPAAPNFAQTAPKSAAPSFSGGQRQAAPTAVRQVIPNPPVSTRPKVGATEGFRSKFLGKNL